MYTEYKLKRLRESTYTPEHYQQCKIRDILRDSNVVLAHADKCAVSLAGVYRVLETGN